MILLVMTMLSEKVSRHIKQDKNDSKSSNVLIVALKTLFSHCSYSLLPTSVGIVETNFSYKSLLETTNANLALTPEAFDTAY